MSIALRSTLPAVPANAVASVSAHEADRQIVRQAATHHERSTHRTVLLIPMGHVNTGCPGICDIATPDLIRHTNLVEGKTFGIASASLAATYR